jgi:hypothetical protein
MAEFSVNASKNIPPTANQGCKVECDSAGENCRCPDDTFDEEVGYTGNKTDEFNPLVPLLQLAGAANVGFEAVFGDGISAPTSTPTPTPTITPIQTQRASDIQIDNDAYDEFSLSLPPLPFWAGSVFANFSSEPSTPEERGQFAALNMAADFSGGGLPSTRVYGSDGQMLLPDFPSFGISNSQPYSLQYTDFSFIGSQIGVE